MVETEIAAPEPKEQTIRSISRALRVLQAINRHGALTMTQISKAVSLPYPTSCRIVNTLVKEGVIEREESRKYYRPTALSQSLSCGYQARVRLVAIARKHIVKLTKDVGWPVAIASRVGSVMVVQDTTNELTALTFADYHPGYTLPIAACASGLAYLAFSGKSERNEIIKQIKLNSNDEDYLGAIEGLTEKHFDIIVDDGYSSSIKNPHTKNPGKTSSIAVPLYYENTVIAALTLIFFSSALRVTEAFEKFREPILEAQTNIMKDLEEIKLFKSEDLELD